ncbi:transposase [Pediococcus damnosus]|nr:hypothetical protein BSQ36_03755 [Pediococcus damnosus]
MVQPSKQLSLSISNGPIEGLNRKIKALKRNCFGFEILTTSLSGLV